MNSWSLGTVLSMFLYCHDNKPGSDRAPRGPLPPGRPVPQVGSFVHLGPEQGSAVRSEVCTSEETTENSSGPWPTCPTLSTLSLPRDGWNRSTGTPRPARGAPRSARHGRGRGKRPSSPEVCFVSKLSLLKAELLTTFSLWPICFLINKIFISSKALWIFSWQKQ